ncbi:T9SS type A sorting domain-containing protein [uncultured Winogradskyella sp.]|uniref:fibronectin type III domain-containing protein n=1 Tax=uncultured Winogradskyella sp. TaxID=395353 RepID=UPI002626D9A7|nr:T9SS type A sorting domain-containing protein [uncultured Winogradskyella sp.]
MKKITLLLAIIAFCLQSNAQLNEGFDATTIPIDWTETILTGTGNDWVFGATQNQNNSVTPRTGAGMAYYFEGSYDNETNRLETPSQDLTSFTTPVLTFYYTQNDWGGDQDELSIWYKDSAGGTWTLIEEYTSSISSWTEVNIILPNPSADYYIGFQGKAFWGRGITIDDASIGEAPSCLPPGNLSIEITSTSTATLNWTATGSETDFTYEYGATGYVQGTGQIGGAQVLGMSSADITGLTPGTDYDFYVQSNCGGDGDSTYAGPFTWTQPDTGQSCGTAYVANLEADCGTATPISLDFTGAPSNIATSCDTFNNYGLWATVTTDAAGGLTVNASAAVDMAVFDMCGGTDIGCYDAGIDPSVDIVLSPNTQYYLYFWQEGTGSTAMVDVCISSYTPSPAPNCAEAPIVPADAATDIALTAGDLNISWTAPSSGPAPTDYEVFFGETSGALVSLGLLGSTDTNVDITGLDFSTTYYWSVVPYNDVTPAAGPCAEWSFTTEGAPLGFDCSNPIVVGALPYNTTDNTVNYGDVYDGVPGTNCSANNYLSGDDVVYSYTAGIDGSISIDLTAIGDTYAGIFVYADCADIGTTCLAGDVNANATDDLSIGDFVVTNGTTYYIVISTWTAPQSTAYTLDITENTCTNATVAYTVVDDCAVSGGFNIEVDITDMGSATDITVTDDQGSAAQTTMSATTLTFGPYVNATDVVITVSDDNDVNCVQSSGVLTQVACPPDNVDCGTAEAVTLGINEAGPQVTGTNVGAGDSGVPDPSCNNFYEGSDLWYSFTTPDNMDELTIDIASSGFSSTIAVLYDNCTDLNEVDCDVQFTSAPTIVFSGLSSSTTYYLRLYDFSGDDFGPISFNISATTSLSIDDVEDASAFTYYPNPVKNKLTLNAQNTIENVTMYNMLGQEVLIVTPNNVDSELDMSSLQGGTYFVKVTIANTTKTIRVIKQ